MDDIISKRPNFLQFLGAFENGEAVMRLTGSLEEVVAGMEQLAQDHGIRDSKGRIDIAISIARKKDHYQVRIETKTKIPKAPASEEIMWATDANGLVLENPRQQKLPFTQIVTRRGGEQPQ